MKKINQLVKKRNPNYYFLVIILIFVIFIWIGDISSWIYIGNGFIIDFILLFVAIIFTVGFIVFWRVSKKAKDLQTQTVERKNTSETLLKTTLENTYDKEIDLLPVTDFTCLACGEKLGNFNEICFSCGSTRPVCIVCLSTLNTNDCIVKLSCCSEFAHYEHIKNWIKIHKFCPSCNTSSEQISFFKVIF